MSPLFRRLILWTVICSVSAAPSFLLGSNRHHRGAMLLGVGIFIVLYTAATSTAAFERFHRRPFVRRTLYIGYGLRLLVSLVFPIGVGSELMILTSVDIWPGILSVQLVDWLGLDPGSFFGTLLTTCVQGTLLNIIIFVIMGIAYAFQRVFMTPPPEFRPHGFDVVMTPAAPLPVTPVADRAGTTS